MNVIAFVLALLLSVPAVAREQVYSTPGRPLVCDPKVMGRGLEFQKCQSWISKVLRPDNPPEYPTRTCCGESDAYIADAFVLEGDKFYAIITRNYEAVEDYEGGGSRGYNKGDRVLIPPEKVNRAFENGGNPSGHGIVFINSSGEVLCYFAPTLG